MIRRTAVTALGLLGALGSTAVRAADPPLEEIQVTATRWPESTFNVPVATNVLDREEIRAATPQTCTAPGTNPSETDPTQRRSQ